MSQVNISIAEDLLEFINEQIREKGYGNVNEYVNYLIQKDKERDAQQRLDNLLLEGLNSGNSIEITDRWLEDKKEELFTLKIVGFEFIGIKEELM